MGLLWLGISTALADTPVLYEDGTDQDAIQAVTERTGLPSDQLKAHPIASLLNQAPVVLGDAVMRHCSGQPTTMTQVRSEIARGESAWRTGGSPRVAMDHLDLAISKLGCLQELADPEPLATLFLLRGALTAVHDPDGAATELRSALALAPSLNWPEDLPPAGAPLLAAARLAGSDHTLSVSPEGTSAGPWIDGRTLTNSSTLQLGAGLHLLQTASTAGIRTAWLVVGGDAHLVLPMNYRRPLLARMHEPSAQTSIGWLLATSSPDFQAGYVTVDDGLWLVTMEQQAIRLDQLSAPTVAVEEAPLTFWQRLRFWRRSE